MTAALESSWRQFVARERSHAVCARVGLTRQLAYIASGECRVSPRPGPGLYRFNPLTRHSTRCPSPESAFVYSFPAPCTLAYTRNTTTKPPGLSGYKRATPLACPTDSSPPSCSPSPSCPLLASRQPTSRPRPPRPSGPMPPARTSLGNTNREGHPTATSSSSE